MRLILLTSEPPLPLGHVSARWYYVLCQQLELEGFEVDVLSSCSKPGELQEASRLFSEFKNIRFNGFSFSRKKSLSKKLKSLVNPGQYQFSSEFIETFKTLASKCDFIHCEQLSTGIVASMKLDVPTLINVHHLLGFDLQDQKVDGFYEGFVRKRQLQFERQLLQRFSNIGAVSEELTSRISEFHPRASLTWIPFALNPDFYTFDEISRPFEFGLVGNMNWYPSWSAAKNVIEKLWPLVLKKKPNAKLLIAGWSARQKLSKYLDVPGLTIEENVEDIREVFQKIQTLIYYPDRGSGVKVKILEAMLMGCSVVTNSSGLEGLKAVPGEHLFASDEMDEFANLALKLVDQPDLGKRMAQSGREYVLKWHNPEKSFGVVKKLYDKILNQK